MTGLLHRGHISLLEFEDFEASSLSGIIVVVRELEGCTIADNIIISSLLGSEFDLDAACSADPCPELAPEVLEALDKESSFKMKHVPVFEGANILLDNPLPELARVTEFCLGSPSSDSLASESKYAFESLVLDFLFASPCTFFI